MRTALAVLSLVSLLAPACDDGGDDSRDSWGEFREAGSCSSRLGEPGIIALESLDASGTPLVEGPAAYVYSSGDATLSGTADIDGDLEVVGDYTANGHPTVTGTVNLEGYPIHIGAESGAAGSRVTKNDNNRIPCIKKGNKCNGNVSGTNLSLNSTETLTLSSGNYYFTSISINGQAQLRTSGKVVIYLDGPATINGGATSNANVDTLTLVSGSTDTIRINGASGAAMHIFAPAAEVVLSGTSDFVGSVIGNVVRLSGTTGLYLTHGTAGSGSSCVYDAVYDANAGAN